MFETHAFGVVRPTTLSFLLLSVETFIEAHSSLLLSLHYCSRHDLGDLIFR